MRDSTSCSFENNDLQNIRQSSTSTISKNNIKEDKIVKSVKKIKIQGTDKSKGSVNKRLNENKDDTMFKRVKHDIVKKDPLIDNQKSSPSKQTQSFRNILKILFTS